jgi:dihydroorotase-like cyclic amidohydrolase
MQSSQIDDIFTYHRPFADQQKRYEQMRDGAKHLAHILNLSCPESREKSLAITSLQQAIMWANASIAINEKEPVT